MRILLCNDDSVHARGIHVLYEYLSKLGDVTVVAPLEEMSTTGHSLTISKPLRMVKIKKNFYGVSGGPADCVQVGVSQHFGKRKPDLIVSGINRGANLGQDVFYSAIDFYHHHAEEKLHYETAGALAVKVIRKFTNGGKSKLKLAPGTLLNLNSPDITLKKVKGITLARQGFRHYSAEILKRRDHRGKDYFWVGGGYHGFLKEKGTDCQAVEDGYASLSPLRLDTTDHEYILELMEGFGNSVLMK
jgi:5'-nucleotidase